MSARVDEELGEGVLALCNGMKFKYNDLVDVIVGTGLGVRGNKTRACQGESSMGRGRAAKAPPSPSLPCGSGQRRVRRRHRLPQACRTGGSGTGPCSS